MGSLSVLDTAPATGGAARVHLLDNFFPSL